MIFFLIGYMGSGKTTIGKLLKRELGMTFVDMDHRIEQESGMRVAEIFAQQGEARFREMERDLIRSFGETAGDLIVATGGGAPCFHDNMEAMNRLGETIYLKVSPEKLTDRLEPIKGHRPLLRDKNRAELEAFVRTNIEAREPFYGQAKWIILCDHLSDRAISERLASEIRLKINR